MIKRFIKNITCNDSVNCSDNIISKIESLRPSLKLKALTKTEKVNGYVSINHVANAHIIEIVFYNNNGQHEFLSNGKRKTNPHDRALKPPSIPTTTEINNIFN